MTKSKVGEELPLGSLENATGRARDEAVLSTLDRRASLIHSLGDFFRRVARQIFPESITEEAAAGASRLG